MQKFLFCCLFFAFILHGYGQTPVDVLHYKFQLELSDETDVIKGEAYINLKLLKPVKVFSVDLVQMRGAGKGMKVSSVTGENVSSFKQQNDKVVIERRNSIQGKDESIQINYSGIPLDGLIISKNKYGDRTFFADNWPDRAHNWIPCRDVPNDKASFEFIVTAPDKYQVISNGTKVEERQLGNGIRLTHWSEKIALPSKVMVIGVAKFAIKIFNDSPPGLPVSAWVYPQDSSKGFYDYGVTTDIVKFFSSYIAPFPYEKLANVQSKTIFGGMENASAIFYAEGSVTGDRKWEDVLAHEIAHQWFGDMVSEKTFSHLWLSEGFATYMTDIYISNKYGMDSAIKRLQKERVEIIQFVKENNHPVVDSTSNLMSLLNINSYQKGSWILHMLRSEVGDTAFRKIIQTFYQQYKGSNADTRDFEDVAEKVSGRNLKSFFDQWLYRSGIPQLKINWQAKNDTLELEIIQTSSKPFRNIPLEYLIEFENGNTIIQNLIVNEGVQKLKIPVLSKPRAILLDPNIKLLFEQKR